MSRNIVACILMCLLAGLSYATDPEDVFWESVKKGNAREEYELYLKQYPQGRYASEARRTIEALREQARAQQEAQRKKQAEGKAAKKAGEDASRREEGELARRQAEQAAERRRMALEAMRPGMVFRDCADCPEIVVIPAGRFMMGSPASEEGRDNDEGPVHQVSLATFALGRTEVTVGEFRKFVQATGYKTEAENDVKWSGCRSWAATDGKWDWRAGHYWDNPGLSQTDAHPVACISWKDAHAYLEWLSRKTGRSYGLPSESQWEYAARAGTTASRYWGDNPDDACRYANVTDKTVGPNGHTWNKKHDCTDGYFFSAPVGSYSPNAFGLYDMLGNVWEWTEDCGNGSYNGAPSDGSAWTSGNCGARVLRGGSWSSGPRDARAANRGRVGASNRVSVSGFRLARILP